MSGRPDILFPLFGAITGLPGVGPKIAKHLVQLNIEKPVDVLFSLPFSGVDRSRQNSVLDVTPPKVATVEVTVGRHHPARQKGRPHRVEVTDSKTTFQLVFFHSKADWLAKLLPTGQKRVVSGKVEVFDGIAQIVHPDHIVPPSQASDIPAYEPIYHLTAGVSQRVMARATRAVAGLAPDLPEWIDPALLEREGWPSWRDAVQNVHKPQRAEDLALETPTRKRLAYDELFAHQITLALGRASRRRQPGLSNVPTGAKRGLVLKALPFEPTAAQKRAVAEIDTDLASKRRMNRLLQGDVGSGKTLVALLSMLAVVEAGGQATLMAPTEILARQHLSSLKAMAEVANVTITLLTGRDTGAARAEKLNDLKEGRTEILVGTHAVFQDDVAFADLRLAVIDEQHRFGVAERMRLGQKGGAVDVLVMTATPIPRSLSLASYGDMDVSILDEKPPGRTPVKTALISDGRLDDVIRNLQGAVAEGRQAYWVCPLVDESEVIDLVAAEERFKKLRAVFGDDVVGLVHGQLPPSDKDAAMAKFSSGETKVLVATTVIEVGVDVPNASIMVIERAERFGLAQLHQLRGRVGRGAEASTCLLMYQHPLSETGRRRLEILRETEDGFRIAEEDLAMRGAGDVLGTAQSGLPRFRIADLERQAGLMATAQSDARRFLADDPSLKSPRGDAVRMLLWLHEQDKAMSLLSVG